MNKTIVPRRSVLYMPGANSRALEKARSLPADALIMDLEDAVSPREKVAARDNVIAALNSGGYGNRQLIIRVNGLNTEWGADDVASAARSGADAILLPKVESVDDLKQAAGLLGSGETTPVLWAMAETPRCILDIDKLCQTGLIAVIVMGTSDLAKSMRIPDDPHRDGLVAALSRCVLAARAHGLDILDGVFGNLTDLNGLRAQCEQGRKLGFDGKTLIHPAQIDAANELFGVSDATAEQASALLSAWEQAAAEGSGIAVVNGRMVENLHADEARRLLALHAAQSAAGGTQKGIIDE